ncbi:MAG: HsmA family protein [Prolixibacteraceae bacterium]
MFIPILFISNNKAIIMTIFMILSTSLITLALIFYSIGVWAERFARYLKGWHLIAFWAGFVFDVTGTWAMSKLSTDPFNIADPHTLSGQLALWLMLTHAIWATFVVFKGSEKHRTEFHNYSLMVWMFWLIPYLGGMWMGMAK